MKFWQRESATKSPHPQKTAILPPIDQQYAGIPTETATFALG
jgi:hypothetical protein